MGCSRLSTIVSWRKLLDLEVVLGRKHCCWVGKSGLSIAIASEAIAGAIAGAIPTILRICTKRFVITTTVIAVPITTKVTPSRVSIPSVISEVTPPASSRATCN